MEDWMTLKPAVSSEAESTTIGQGLDVAVLHQLRVSIHRTRSMHEIYHFKTPSRS